MAKTTKRLMTTLLDWRTVALCVELVAEAAGVGRSQIAANGAHGDSELELALLPLLGWERRRVS